MNDDWNYLTTIIDLADRKVVGWTLSEDMTVENTIYKAWLLARSNRKISPDHIFHSDRGVQYASNKMNLILNENKLISKSMSRKGNCWDNAVAESFFHLLKRERIRRQTYLTRDAARQDVFDYIEMFYNPTRKHTNNGMLSPVDYEMKQRKMNEAGV